MRPILHLLIEVHQELFDYHFGCPLDVVVRWCFAKKGQEVLPKARMGEFLPEVGDGATGRQRCGPVRFERLEDLVRVQGQAFQREPQVEDVPAFASLVERPDLRGDQLLQLKRSYVGTSLPPGGRNGMRDSNECQYVVAFVCCDLDLDLERGSGLSSGLPVHLRLLGDSRADVESELVSQFCQGAGHRLDAAGTSSYVVEVFAVSKGGGEVEFMQRRAPAKHEFVLQIRVLGDLADGT